LNIRERDTFFPRTARPGGQMDDPAGSPRRDALFSLPADLRPLREGPPPGKASETDPEKSTRRTSGLAVFRDEDGAGIAPKAAGCGTGTCPFTMPPSGWR
jgi:hypothetical protein